MVYLSDSLHNQLTEIANGTGRSRSEALRRLIEQEYVMLQSSSQRVAMLESRLTVVASSVARLCAMLGEEPDFIQCGGPPESEPPATGPK